VGVAFARSRARTTNHSYGHNCAFAEVPFVPSPARKEKLMADHQPPHSIQQREVPFPEPQEPGRSGETGWSMALKSIVWFLVVPGAVMLLVKWFLQP